MKKRSAWVLAAGIAALALGAAAVGAVAVVLRGGGRSSLGWSGGQYLSLELAGELPVQVEFVLDAALADKLMDDLRVHKLNLFYVRYAVDAGVL